jgi:hypothetical protein
MALDLQGDNINIDGVATQIGAPTSANHCVRKGDVIDLWAYVEGLDLNTAAPADLSVITIANATRWILLEAVVIDPTANLSAAIVDVRTASGGGGTAIVGAETLSSLTGTDTYHDCTVDSTAIQTATTIYPRITTASGVAGTAALLLKYRSIGEL